MDPERYDEFPDAASVPDAAESDVGDDQPEQAPPATAAPSAEPPATRSDPPAPQIDPNEFEYYRQRASEADLAEGQRRQHEAEQQSRYRLMQADMLVEQRSKQAQERARQIAQYDQDAAFQLLAQTEQENRGYLRQMRQGIASAYEQQIGAERMALAAPEYARAWSQHYDLPQEYGEALAGLPVEQIPQQAYILALSNHQAKVARYEADQERRRQQAQRVAASRGNAATANGSGLPRQGAPDGSDAQLRGALAGMYPDLYRTPTR